MCRLSVLVMIDELILMRTPVEPVRNTVARRLNSSHMRSQENGSSSDKLRQTGEESPRLQIHLS